MLVVEHELQIHVLLIRVFKRHLREFSQQVCRMGYLYFVHFFSGGLSLLLLLILNLQLFIIVDIIRLLLVKLLLEVLINLPQLQLEQPIILIPVDNAFVIASHE